MFDVVVVGGVDDVQVPFYARTIEGQKWTSVIFYRPPGCVPRDFNLVSFFDVPGTSAGIVIGQDPTAGATVHAGDTVTLFVA